MPIDEQMSVFTIFYPPKLKMRFQNLFPSGYVSNFTSVLK